MAVFVCVLRFYVMEAEMDLKCRNGFEIKMDAIQRSKSKHLDDPSN